MPISRTDKEALVDALLETKRKGHRLEISLRFKGKDAEADEVQARNGELALKIDDLLAALMDSWLGSAATLMEDIRKINTKLQACIRDIRKNIKTAENIVKATEHLDRAVETAAKLLA